MCIATSAERPSAQLSFFPHRHQNCGCGEHHCASALASSLHGMGDCARHQCVALSSSDDVLAMYFDITALPYNN